MRDPLFHDGWREPSDDLFRTMYFISWALGFLGGIGLFIYSLGAIFGRSDVQVETSPGEHSAIPGLPIFFLILSELLMLRTGLKLYPEIKRLRSSKMKADAVVAGAFLTGFALILLGMEDMAWSRRTLHSNSFGWATWASILIICGVAVLLITLVVGLVIAFAPNVHFTRTLANVIVESRYGIDKKLMEIYDHPNPVEEECVPMVRLKAPDGKVLLLRAGAVAYDLAAPGMRGTAQIAGSRLKSFKPVRRA